MNKEDIILMAREAGYHNGVATHDIALLERFATLVAAAERKKSEQEISMMSEHCAELILAERDACAKVCEYQGSRHDYLHKNWGDHCASLIRARGQQ